MVLLLLLLLLQGQCLPKLLLRCRPCLLIGLLQERRLLTALLQERRLLTALL